MNQSLRASAALISMLMLASPALAEGGTPTDIGTLDKGSAEKVYPTKRPYSPYAGRNFPTRPLFGDTHLAHVCLV